MTKPYVNNKSNDSPENLDAIFQGAMIDENGRETPITEAMIQRACKLLEQEALAIYNDELTDRQNLWHADSY